MALSPHVRRGQSLRIPSTDYNAFLDAAEAHKRSRRGQGAGLPGDVHQPGIILVRNTHNDVLPQFAAVGLEGPIILPAANPAEFKARVAINCVVPTADHLGKFAILREPLLPGAVGQAVASGVTPALLTIASESSEYCDVTAGSTALVDTAAGSAQILYNPGAAPVPNLGVVRLWGKQPSAVIYPPAFYFSPVVIHSSTTSPAQAANEIRTSQNGVFFRQYINDPDESGVEYLWTDPVTSPSTEWDDATFQFNRTGAWLIHAGWTIAGTNRDNWGAGSWGTLSQNTGPASAGTAHTHTEEYFLHSWAEFFARFDFRESAAASFNVATAPFLANVITTAHGLNDDYTSSSHAIVNLLAGSQLRILASNSSNVSGSGAILGRFVLRSQYLGEAVPASSSALNFGIAATAPALPAAGDHTNNF